MGGCPTIPVVVVVVFVVGMGIPVRVVLFVVVPNAVAISHSRNAACRAIEVCFVSNVVVVVLEVMV